VSDRDGLIGIAEIGGNLRRDLTAERRRHDERDQNQVEQDDRRLARRVGAVFSPAGQDHARQQCRTHPHLDYENHVGAEWSGGFS